MSIIRLTRLAKSEADTIKTPHMLNTLLLHRYGLTAVSICTYISMLSLASFAAHAEQGSVDNVTDSKPSSVSSSIANTSDMTNMQPNNRLGQMGYTSNALLFSYGSRRAANSSGEHFAQFDTKPNIQPNAKQSGSIFLDASSMHSFDSDSNSAASNAIKIPELSDGDRFVDQYQHLILGQWSLQQLNAHLKTLDDAWIQEELSNVVWDINAQARSQAPLALVVIDDPSINAFAIPGGVIGLNVGTVLAANSLDEVASVLAHEVAHLSQRHYEHGQEANKKALWMQVGGLLAAIAASAADGDAAAAIMMGSQTAAMDSRMAFSRDNEREADRVGMQILAQSGYDPRAMPRFFATLNQQNQLNLSKKSYLPSFIMSHPLSSERLSEAQTRANSYPPLSLSQTQRHQHRFDLLQWRMRVAAQQTSEAALTTAAKQSVGAKLALADWYGQHGRYAEAASIFEQITQLSASEQQALQPLLAITQAQVAGYQAQWQQAEQLLQRQQALYPERRDLRLYLADVWLHSGKAQQVQALVKSLLIRQPHDLPALSRMQTANEQLAKQADKSGNKQLAQIATINALRYRSQSERWRADFAAAQVSLQQAKLLAEAMINSPDKAESDNQEEGDKISNNKINNKTNSASNVRPLLATINSEMAALKAAKDYKP